MKPCRKTFTQITILLLGGAAPLVVMAGPAPTDSTTASPDSDSLESITVVAQKQNIDLQKAAVSITALSGATLAESNIVTPLDLNGQVPGLVIGRAHV